MRGLGLGLGRWVLAALCVLSGCAGVSAGELTTSGFVHEDMKYAIRYTNPQKQRFLDKDWRVANFDKDDNRIKGRQYEITLLFDLDQDGNYKKYKHVPRYDLKLEHRVTNSVIWVRTIPLAWGDKKRGLDALMRSYIKGISGADLYSVDMGAQKALAEVRRFATRIVDQQACSVAGRPAYAASVDLASVDQLQLEAESRWERARLVLISPTVRYSLAKRSNSSDDARVPAVIMVGYTSDPETYEENLPAFEQLLTQISIEGNDGDASCLQSAPAPKGEGDDPEGETTTEANEAPVQEDTAPPAPASGEPAPEAAPAPAAPTSAPLPANP